MSVKVTTKPVIVETNTNNKASLLLNNTGIVKNKISDVHILPKQNKDYNIESYISLPKNEKSKDTDKIPNGDNNAPKTLWQKIKNGAKSLLKAFCGMGAIGTTITGAKIGGTAGATFGISYIIKKFFASGILGKIGAAISAKNVISACKVFGKISGGIIGFGISLLAMWGIEKLLEDKQPQQEFA